MAVITSTTTGNFSAGATWVGGIVPGAGDDAVAATGTIVTIDTDVTVISFQQAGTGKFVLGDNRTVSGNVIANAGTFASGGTVEVTAGVGTTATITGNVTGVSTTTANTAGIVVTGVGTLVLNGTVTGSPGNAGAACAGVYTNVNSSISITGDVSGAFASNKIGVLTGASATTASVTVIGNVTGQGQGGIPVLGHGISQLGSNASANITGNVTSTGGNNTYGVVQTGTSASLIVTGNVTGAAPGATGSPLAISQSGTTSTCSITGDVTAGLSFRAMDITGSSAILAITGSVLASVNIGAVLVSGASSTVNVVGNVTAAGTLAHGIQSNATANGVIFQGNLTDSLQGATAIYSRLLRVTATNTGTTTYTNTVGYPNGTPVTRVSPDLVTGMPAISNVRSGTVYGYNSELTGTVAIPPTGSVALGVEVGNTTGTAALDVGSVIAVVGAQIAAAASDPVGI